MAGTSAAALKTSRAVYFAESGGPVDCPVYDRYGLGPDFEVPGPAIVEEVDSTTVIHPGTRPIQVRPACGGRERTERVRDSVDRSYGRAPAREPVPAEMERGPRESLNRVGQLGQNPPRPARPRRCLTTVLAFMTMHSLFELKIGHTGYREGCTIHSSGQESSNARGIPPFATTTQGH